MEIREMYPEAFEGNKFKPWMLYDYQPMLESFGDILLQVDEDDYQGDSWLIYKGQNNYGFLEFGWGSCSGCDALQAVDSVEELEELRDTLSNKIKWFDTAKGLLDWMESKDWEGEWCYSSSDFKRFLKQAKTVLKKCL